VSTSQQRYEAIAIPQEKMGKEGKEQGKRPKP